MAVINQPACDDFILCRLIINNNKYDFDEARQSNIEPRSYYNFGVPTSPAYYPAFDPISVLASLAFLAFLLQSFASLFDRSRSILPTVMSARESTENIDEIEKRVVTALENYAHLENSMKQSDSRNKLPGDH